MSYEEKMEWLSRMEGIIMDHMHQPIELWELAINLEHVWIWPLYDVGE